MTQHPRDQGARRRRRHRRGRTRGLACAARRHGGRGPGAGRRDDRQGQRRDPVAGGRPRAGAGRRGRADAGGGRRADPHRDRRREPAPRCSRVAPPPRQPAPRRALPPPATPGHSAARCRTGCRSCARRRSAGRASPLPRRRRAAADAPDRLARAAPPRLGARRRPAATCRATRQRRAASCRPTSTRMSPRHGARRASRGRRRATPGRRRANATTTQAITVIGLRRRIAVQMQESKRRIPHFSYVEEIDVTELEALRAALNAKWGAERGAPDAAAAADARAWCWRCASFRRSTPSSTTRPASSRATAPCTSASPRRRRTA